MYLYCACLQVFRTRQQLFKSITPDYYGFRDEEDGVLLAVEAEAEAAMQAKVGWVAALASGVQGIDTWLCDSMVIFCALCERQERH